MELSEQRSVFGNGSLGGNYGNNGGITLDPNRTPRAGGGPVFGGMSYPWNEPTARPEILIPTGNGYVLNRQQAQEALAMAARGPQMAGGLSIAPGAIQVVGAPGMSEEFLGETLMRKIERDYGVLAGLRSKGRR
jgi:hypothetical protein